MAIGSSVCANRVDWEPSNTACEAICQDWAKHIYVLRVYKIRVANHSNVDADYIITYAGSGERPEIEKPGLVSAVRFLSSAYASHKITIKNSAMSIRIFAINLDRSQDRWQRLSAKASELGLGVTRVSAVDGKCTAEDAREETDDLAFRRNAGRLMLSGEYGCYRSHIRALQTFLESGAEVGLIIEDDVELKADLQDRAIAAFNALPDADVIKFFNHRVVGFKKSVTTALGDEIGRAIHGPLGSSACYGVTRRGAMLLVKHLTIMRYPWDAALERGWSHGGNVYTTRHNVATTAPAGTTIATRDIYRSVKFPKWKRLGTYWRRLRDDVLRLRYALRA